MAQIVTITNPLTGQPVQVDELDHTAQEIDGAIARALPGGAIDITLQNKVDGLESTDYPGCYYRTVDGVVEWLNPPTELGDEYRTTERYLGKPVYVKAVNVSVLPSAGSYVAPDHAIANFGYCVECCGSLVNGTSIPYVNINREGQILLGVNSNGIRIYSDIDLSALTAVVKIKYTKTTD